MQRMSIDTSIWYAFRQRRPSVSGLGAEGKGEDKLANCYTRLRDCWEPRNEKGLRQEAADESSEREGVLRLAEVNDLAFSYQTR